MLVTGVAVSSWGAGRQPEKTGLAHRTGRVAANLPENGSLGKRIFGGEEFAIRWPGEGGKEYVEEGGFMIRLRVEGEERPFVFGPAAFRGVNSRIEANVFHEGDEGGIRYPLPGCDDDGDGRDDEDPLDYLDNDQDGAIDEDFGITGNEMAVALGVEPVTGITLTQSSYTWSYGHVRDFIGFTSEFRYPESGEKQSPDIIDLQAALYARFAIGRGETVGRADDDETFLIRKKEGGEQEREDSFLHYPCVCDGGGKGCCALVVFNFEGPGAQGSPDYPVIAGRRSSPDSLMCAAGQEREEGRDKEETLRHENAIYKELAGAFEVSTKETGEKTVVSKIGAIPRLCPGEKFTIEWALVFGGSEERLARNIDRAIETYKGVAEKDGKENRWIVPARKASHITLPGRLAPIWVRGGRRPAASIIVPEGIDEEIEWLKVAGETSETFEQIGQRVMITIEDRVIEKSEAFLIEGQLSDGTLFAARISENDIAGFAADEPVSPGRLPEECMSVFPNPFASSLNVSLRISDAPVAGGAAKAEQIQGISSVKIYDVKGRLVRTVMPEEYLHPGDYNLGWDGNDENGMPVSAGVYYCKLQIDDRTLTKRIILLR